MAFDLPRLPVRKPIEGNEPEHLPTCCPPPHHSHQNISSLAIILICVLGGCSLLIGYYAVLAKYCSRRNRFRGNPTQSNATHDDFLDGNHGPVVDHPIWLINTVGLDESVISSIPICKFKKGDGLIDGTECSVCLNEFQEDENIRLLPKCSHAFHLHCIDTWLRSHTNCPLCRAPIVAATTIGPNSTATERNPSNLGSQEETFQIENSESEVVLGSGQVGDAESVEEERELQEGRRKLDSAKEEDQVVEDGIQPVRRSVSMDSYSVASIFCFSMGNSVPEEAEGRSATEAVGAKKSKHIGSGPGTFRGKGTCSSFKGLSSQGGSANMKRSFSSGGKFLFSRGNGNQSSILPL